VAAPGPLHLYIINQYKPCQNGQDKHKPTFTTQTTNKTTMKKIVLAAASFLSFGITANAQNASGSASQTIQIGITNALEITFTGSGTATGATVNLPFVSVTDYASGVESTAQQLKVRSNRNFSVTVKSGTPNFTVTNAGVTTTSSMPVSGVLAVKVASNQTNGTVAPGFEGFGNLTTTAQNMINNGEKGGNQTFSVLYKATPGFTYPAGTYATDVVYTATQQ
jgi:hypothetical protein